jgi:hypothetical protein
LESAVRFLFILFLQANKARALEQDKAVLLESNNKILEIKVKMETTLQSEKSHYAKLRFDGIATQTLSVSVNDFVALMEKNVKLSMFEHFCRQKYKPLLTSFSG